MFWTAAYLMVRREQAFLARTLGHSRDPRERDSNPSPAHLEPVIADVRDGRHAADRDANGIPGDAPQA